MIHVQKDKGGSTKSSPSSSSHHENRYYCNIHRNSRVFAVTTFSAIIYLLHHLFSFSVSSGSAGGNPTNDCRCQSSSSNSRSSATTTTKWRSSSSSGSTTATTTLRRDDDVVRMGMSRDEIRDLIHECPPERTLSIRSNNNNNATTASASSLQDFINATLRSLSRASKDITGRDRPIEHLAKQYDEFRSIQNGFWAEFGVFKGGTLMMAHEELIGTSRQSKFRGGIIAGFDSFEGLPERWRGGFGKGAFGATKTASSLYETVRTMVPNSVELYKGWFQDTIQDFKTRHPDVPAAVIHHDGDLFSSTTITLQLLDDRIAPGTHMVFDELVGYKGYEGHEILALWLWMNQQGVSLCAMGHMGVIEDLSDWLNPQRDVHFTAQSAWFQVLSRDVNGGGMEKIMRN